MSALSDYKSWHDHYLAMVNGQIAPNHKTFVVDTKQSGSGKIQIVSPSQQKVERARSAMRAKSRKAIKSKQTKKVGQKRPKRRTVKTKAAPKKRKR